MRSPKQILKVVGICAVALGVIALPFQRTNPKAFSNFFNIIAMTGAFTRPGVIAILVGVVCLAIAALLPERWQ